MLRLPVAFLLLLSPSSIQGYHLCNTRQERIRTMPQLLQFTIQHLNLNTFWDWACFEMPGCDLELLSEQHMFPFADCVIDSRLSRGVAIKHLGERRRAGVSQRRLFACFHESEILFDVSRITSHMSKRFPSSVLSDSV